jgi:hypothetical protein
MPKGSHPNHRNAGQHYRWNRGRLLSSHGYVKVRVGRGHPLADPNGYTYEHLLVWVSGGRMKPSKDEVIHHRNGDKSDNRLDNLELMKRCNHSVYHGKGITNDQVLELRVLYAQGVADMPRLAILYGIPVARVSKIIRGEARKSVGGPTSQTNRGKNEFPTTAKEG